MTGTRNIYGPGPGIFGQIGRWMTLAAVAVAGAFMLFFSAAFALILISVIAMLAVISVGIFWMRAKLTGRPFGPRAQMEAHMAEMRRQMGVDPRKQNMDSASTSMRPNADGPVIDAHQTPEGWTVER